MLSVSSCCASAKRLSDLSGSVKMEPAGNMRSESARCCFSFRPACLSQPESTDMSIRNQCFFIIFCKIKCKVNNFFGFANR